MSSVVDASSLNEPVVIVTRMLDAPRSLVWDAITDPKHVAHWYGGPGFTNPVCEMDVKPGGVWRFIMHGPDGVDYKNRIVYLEIVEPERLVYKHDPERGSEPVSFQVTVTFAEQDGKTKLTMHMLFPSAAERDYVVTAMFSWPATPREHRPRA